MPQEDNNDSKPGIIEMQVYENERFDASHDGINGTDNSTAYITGIDPCLLPSVYHEKGINKSYDSKYENLLFST